MFHTSYIELSKSAFKKNVTFLRSLIGEKPIYSAVVKGNAYGHGISPFVKLAEKNGIRHFSVFCAAEAFEVLKVSEQMSKIMITGAIEDEELEWAIKNGISFYVFDIERLYSASKIAQKLSSQAKIHLELETGLNRTGFVQDQLEQVINFLKDNLQHISIEGICTHYAGAESVSNYLRIQNQISTFSVLVTWLKKQGIYAKTKHTACSAAAISYPDTIMDMVRFGIAGYGFWPSQETQMQYYLQKQVSTKETLTKDPLTRVLKWKSHVMTIKKIKRGEFISYGTTYLAPRDMVVASIPIGYYHGFSRSLSNKGQVLLRGRRSQIVGMVNMHMMMIDITDFTDIKKGEEVVIIGKQRRSEITVGAFSDLTRDLSYEILVRLPNEIPRIVVD